MKGMIALRDEQIIELYWARDQRAIAETERSYGALCRGLARRILRSAGEAEIGQRIGLRLRDGSLGCIVESRKEQDG